MRLGFRLALVWIALICVVSLCAPILPISSPMEMDLATRLESPSWNGSFFGSDSKGRDLFARVLFGARVSLSVGLFGSLIALLIGVPWGAIAGLRGGKLGQLMMRIADGLESLPMVVVVLFLLSILGEYQPELSTLGIGRIHIFYFAIGILFWVPTARVSRAEALRLREAPFVLAAQSMGVSQLRILSHHMLPNMSSSLLIMFGLTIPRVVLMEAFLSFLGLGVEPPAVSWGLLAASGMATLNPLVDCWWLLFFPSLALAATLWALNTVADHLRSKIR